MKAELHLCIDLLESDFSLITVSENKIPNIKWKEYQTSCMSKDTFENFYNMPNTAGVGIVTGYNGLEVIDVDLKVLQTVSEKLDFWNNYLSFLKDNIYDFEKKFVIVKTRNSGFHIIYKCDKPIGNKKIETLQSLLIPFLKNRE